jgi:hypothetical protein
MRQLEKEREGVGMEDKIRGGEEEANEYRGTFLACFMGCAGQIRCLCHEEGVMCGDHP